MSDFRLAKRHYDLALEMNSEAHPHHIRALRARQIQDGFLDFSGTPEQIGKISTGILDNKRS
ncbi:hypothetical protein F5146DRAFT_1125816 [Armillaria mellea]|nr:hypothetical protein F5146DRAFT_1125816 [Armillaria mellea]